MALYNKMRPRNLDAVKGQNKIVDIIKQNIASGNLPNAMLFVGTRGVGKTTVAKVVSRLINCEHPLENGNCCDECTSCKAILAGTSLDVKELDAASNNGVDNIRDIIEDVQYKAIGKYKVYIIDEVHMLSTGAFNALLKVMEEPPKNVLFILCTTELHKVPATIISRCRKFQFETISVEVIVEKLKEINELLGKDAEEEALFLVAKAANGSMRDAESIYEAFLDSDDRIMASYVREVLGFTAEESVFAVLDSIVKSEPVMATSVIEEIVEKGGSLSFLLEECVRTLMDVVSLKMSGDVTDKGNSPEYLEKITGYAFDLELPRLFEITDSFCKAYGSKQNSVLGFQAMLIELACTQSTVTELLERVRILEEKVASLQSGTVVMSSYSDVESNEDISVPCSETEITVTQETSELPAEDVELPMENDVESRVSQSQAAADDELLRAMGFSVVDSCPFDEDELDDKLVEEDYYGSGNVPVTEEASVETAESQDTTSVEEDVAGNEPEASFFDDFARLFGM